jgi:hypothetical protein
MHARWFLFNDGAEAYPVLAAIEMNTTGLVMCPLAVVAGAGLVPGGYAELYRMAYADAVAAARSVRFERLLRYWPN